MLSYLKGGENLETRKVAGYRRVEFRSDDGSDIHGWNVYFLIQMDKSDRQDGCRGDKVYIPDNVCRDSNYLPQVGDEITICFNRYGKVSKIILE